MKKCTRLLLLLFQIYHQAHCEVIYIRLPRDTVCPFQPCQTLMQYVNSPSISSNTTLVMSSGNHVLSAQLSVEEKVNFTMVASPDASPSIVTCSGLGKLALNTILDAKISGLSFVGCGGNTAESVDNFMLQDSNFMDGLFNILVDAGGAWLVSGSTYVVMKNSTFTDNRATGIFRSGEGGAIAIRDAKNLIIERCTFSNNQVTGDSRSEGGALSITATNSVSTIIGCTFSNNHVNGSRGSGGALYIDIRNSSVTIKGCTFNNNQINGSRGEGGAIFITTRNSTSTISQSTFTSNQLKERRGEGGALYISASTNSTSVVSECTFMDNQVDGDFSSGGAVYISGTANSISTVYVCTFTNNQVGGSHGDGGALVVRGTTNSTNSVSECTFTDNQINDSHGNGGALYVSGTTDSISTISVCTFVNNQINESHGEGGALYASSTSNSSSTVSTCTFVKNQINGSHGEGGALFISGIRNSTTFVGECTFMNNQVNNSHGDGGALLLSDTSNSTGTVSACTFINNQINGPFGAGGALSVSSTRNSTSTISVCTFINNQVNGSHGEGGALHVSAGDQYATINGCNFTNNQAVGSFGEGGALYVLTSLNLTVERCIFDTNMAIASSGQGGALYVRSPVVNLKGCNFINNEANENGGAVYVNGQPSLGEMTVFQCQFSRSRGEAIYGENLREISIHQSTFTNNLNGRVAIHVSVSSRSLATIQDLTSQILVVQSAFAGNDGALESTNIKQISIHGSNFTNQTGNLRVLQFQGIGVSDSSIFINNCNFKHNKGGVIYGHNMSISIHESTFVENIIKNNSFSRNTANYNGGIFNANTCTIDIVESTFTNNSALNYGGVAHAVNSAITIMDSVFNHNMAISSGGLFSLENSNITADDTTFLNNKAGTNGGVVYAYSSHIKHTTFIQISKSRLSENVALKGGIVYAQDNIIEVVFERNCLDFSNATVNGAFAAIWNATFSFTANNNAATEGGDIYACNGSVIITQGGVNINVNNDCLSDNCTQSDGNACKTYDLVETQNGRIINQEAIATCSVDFDSESDKTRVYTAIIVSLSICGILILLTALVTVMAILVKCKKVKKNSKSISSSNFTLQGKYA